MAIKRRSMKCIVEEIKSIMSPYLGEKKVLNSDVACALRMPVATLNTQICRDSPPFEELLEWCAKTGVEPMGLFYEKNMP